MFANNFPGISIRCRAPVFYPGPDPCVAVADEAFAVLADEAIRCEVFYAVDEQPHKVMTRILFADE